ncbi:hypothetical protein BB934_45220 (plasmid) [Microvirga ossetica]|uniref:HIRAN domain-containing protein n=1 Tax=Microvirga ossetica TaxID=1882682 RepID=A0A1B2EZR3_9HYPH|nr:HIRAN domain-containing protein [Microvirga ossetica]ANY85423.1 hypothetical protein BB934_45220 [Microvirga ossetica]
MYHDLIPIDDLLTELGERPGTRWCQAPVAGLQYGDYDEKDELRDELLRPQPNERLQVVRRPTNPKDSNAIEIWFRNGRHKLGHVPAFLAADLAPEMDADRDLRAYALNGGSGEAWSVKVVLVGAAVTEDRHREAVRVRLEREEHAARWAFLEAEAATEGRERERTHAKRARDSDKVWQRDRINRMRDAVAALATLTEAQEALPEGHNAPPPEQGVVFPWWDQVPACLATKNIWRERGRTIPAKTKPWATISYNTRRKGQVTYPLFAFSQTRKVATTASTIRSILEPLERRLRELESQRDPGGVVIL